MRNEIRVPRRTTASDTARVQRLLCAACCLVLLLAAGAAPTAGQEWTWKPVRLGGGGYITGLDIHADGTRVIRTDTYGAYKWNAALGGWEQLVTVDSMPAADSGVEMDTEGVFEIKIAPSDSSIMYMALRGYVYKTTNGGTTWTRTGFSQLSYDGNGTSMAANGTGDRVYGNKMAIDPNDPDKALLGTRMDGLWITRNGGASWSQVPHGNVPHGSPAGNQPGVTGICFKSSNVIYTGSWDNGIYRSADGGSNWTRIADGAGDPDRAMDSACDNGNFYVVDGVSGAANLWRYDGSTWSEVYRGGRAHIIAADPHVTDRIVVGTDYGHVLVSLDAGDTWDNDPGWYRSPIRASADVAWHTSTDESYMSAGDMMFDGNAAPGTLLFAQGIGVWKTDLSSTPAASVSWTGISKGIENLVVEEIVAPPNESYVHFAVEDRGTFSFSNVDTFPSQHGPGRTMNHSWAMDYVATDSSNPKLVMVSERVGVQYSATSTDRGANWSDMTDFSPANNYAGGLAASTDTNFVGYLGSNVGAFYTKNGGSSWTHITDFGNQIHNNKFLNKHIITADHVTPGRFWLYYVDGSDCVDADTGLWRTTDGGVNWAKVFDGYIVSCGFDAWNGELKSVPGHQDHLFWTGGDAGGGAPNPGAYFRHSTNGGATWTTIEGVLEVKAFGFGSTFGSYPRIYIAGWVDNVWGIHYSDDAGVNWTQIGGYPLGSFDRITAVEGAKDGTERVYVGFRGSGAVYATLSTGGTLQAPQTPILLP